MVVVTSGQANCLVKKLVAVHILDCTTLQFIKTNKQIKSGQTIVTSLLKGVANVENQPNVNCTI